MRSASLLWRRAFLLICFPLVAAPLFAQVDGGETYDHGEEILQSLFFPYIPNAPFSLTLKTEWVRPLNNGGTFTLVNERPIRRDSRGRLYQERWSLVPRGSNVRSVMTWIQIADPKEHTLLECSARQHACELEDLNDRTGLRLDPSRLRSGALPNGAGTITHEDLGGTSFAGVPVHLYRDTTTLNPGVQGNDLPMSYVREYRFSPELGFNITSLVDNPHFGKQIFTASEVSTTEPDAHLFDPPEGYRIVDHRKSAMKPAARP